MARHSVFSHFCTIKHATAQLLIWSSAHPALNSSLRSVSNRRSPVFNPPFFPFNPLFSPTTVCSLAAAARPPSTAALHPARHIPLVHVQLPLWPRLFLFPGCVWPGAVHHLPVGPAPAPHLRAAACGWPALRGVVWAAREQSIGAAFVLRLHAPAGRQR